MDEGHRTMKLLGKGKSKFTEGTPEMKILLDRYDSMGNAGKNSAPFTFEMDCTMIAESLKALRLD